MTTATPPGRREWRIAVDSWVLQDGNHADFVTGERRRFALELGYRRDRRLQRLPAAATVTARHTGRGAAYDVVGRLVRAAAEPHRDGFVLDFGLRAYSNWMVLDDHEPPRAGDWVAGEIALGVDPFFYRDELAALPGMPPLTYTWTVLEIERDLTPTMLVEPGHPLHTKPAGEGLQRVRDVTREAWSSVERTRAWEHDGGYRLTCRLEDVAPTSGRAADRRAADRRAACRRRRGARRVTAPRLVARWPGTTPPITDPAREWT